MAISWGNWSSGSGIQSRLGVEWSQSPGPSGVTKDTTSVTVYADVYLQVTGWVQDSFNTLSIGGNFSYSGTKSISAGGPAVIHLQKVSRSFAPSYSGTTVSTATASLSGFVGGSPALSSTYVTARRPYQPAADVTNVGVARVSDAQHTVSWTNHPSSSAPYSGIYIDRWDNAGNKWLHVATASASATSWSDKGTVANRRYRYRVIPYNSSGNDGSHAYSPYVNTTPAAPTSVGVVKTTSGDVRVSWTNQATDPSGFQIWHAADGVWDGTALATVSGAALTSWTHNDPDPAATHTYRVKSYADEGSFPRLYSAYSAASSVVQLLAAPSAPSLVFPVSQVVAGGEPLTVRWVHNPVDSSPQRQYQVWQRGVGGLIWHPTGIIESSAQQHTFPVTPTSGITYEWYVETWGAHPGKSPQSAVSTFTVSDRPTAAINYPPSDSHDSSSLTVTWGYFDPEGTAQSQWRATLYDGSGTVIEARSGTGTAEQTTFNHALADATVYRVGVEVRDGAGLWSLEDVETFTVTYAKPPVPEVVASWDVDTGTVIVTISNGVPAEGEVSAVRNRVFRSANNADWVTVADNVPPDGSVSDYLPVFGDGTINTYRVEAVSDLPSRSQSPDVPVVVSTRDSQSFVYVNGGAGFSRVARVRGNARMGVGFSREKTLHHFDGRAWPVEFTGPARTQTGTLTVNRVASYAAADMEAAVQDLMDMVDLPAPACIRTPMGHRWFVTFTDVSADWFGVMEDASMSFARVDHDEGAV